MAWDSLSQRLATLPLILAGPVLRRTEATSVTVWLALKKAGRVTLTIYQGGMGSQGSVGTAMFSGELSTVQLGENLHVVAVTAETTLNGLFLVPGIIYSYDLEFNDFAGFNSFDPITLASSNIYSFDGILDEIVYGNYLRPTFALPPADINNLHILHGSCRKPHGGTGEPDALPYADDIIEIHHADANARPHQFYHTGDQIYADDVASVLLYMLDDAGKNLFGWVEPLSPLSPDLAFVQDSTNQSLPQDPQFVINEDGTSNKYSIQPGQRLKVVQDIGGFSVDVAGPSHLIRFAEYSAMYLFVWSDVLWPVVPSQATATYYYPTFKQVLPLADEKTHYKGNNVIQGDSNDKSQFDTELNYILSFRRGLKKVRRVLANVPSYMMCDDHEVTDDWFISSRWCNRVYASPLGKRIVQNGLSAFAVFQAWGNKPEDFKDVHRKPESLLLGWLSTIASERGADPNTWVSAQNRVLPARRLNRNTQGITAKVQGNVKGRLTTELVVDGVLDYSFFILFDNFALLAINSRTERGLVENPKPRLGPALLHPDALTRQVKNQVQNLPSSVEITLVICPAPVFGHGIVEGFLQTKILRDFDNRMATAPTLVLPVVVPTASPYLPMGPLLFSLKSVSLASETSLNIDESSDREGWSFNQECMESLLKELSVCKKVVLFSGDVHYGFSPMVDYYRRPDPATPGYPERASFTQLVCSSMKNSDAKTYSTGNAGSVELDEKVLHYAGWDRPGLHNYKLKTSNLGVQLDPPNTPYEDNFHFVELEIIAPELQIVDPVNDAPQWTYNVRFAKDNRSISERFDYDGSDLQPEYTPPSSTIGRYIYNMGLIARSRLLGQNIAVGYTQIGQVKFDLNQNQIYHNFWFKVPAQSDTAKPGPITKHTLNIS